MFDSQETKMDIKPSTVSENDNGGQSDDKTGSAYESNICFDLEDSKQFNDVVVEDFLEDVPVDSKSTLPSLLVYSTFEKQNFRCSVDRQHFIKVDPRTFMCPVCDAPFISLRKHVQCYKTQNGSFKCYCCCRLFRRGDSLTRHLKIHAGFKPFTCGDCFMTFGLNYELTQHIRQHKGEHDCRSHCGKSFSSAVNLKMHLRRLTGEKPFRCEACWGTFTDVSTLKSHLLRHKGMKLFACDFCGKGFLKMSDWKRHRSTHTGDEDKRFQCSACDKRFFTASYLKDHLIKHPGIHKSYSHRPRLPNKKGPFVCLVCGLRTKSSTTLTIHTRVHTGEKPYECESCSTCFKSKSDLAAHLRRHLRCNK